MQVPWVQSLRATGLDNLACMAQKCGKQVLACVQVCLWACCCAMLCYAMPCHTMPCHAAMLQCCAACLHAPEIQLSITSGCQRLTRELQALRYRSCRLCCCTVGTGHSQAFSHLQARQQCAAGCRTLNARLRWAA